MDEIHQKLQQIAEKELASSAHNMEHVMRVRDLCMLLAAAESRENLERKRKGLAKGEADVDMDVLEAAVLLHDIARAKEDKDSSGNIDHAILGSVMAEKILRDNGYPEEKIKKVVRCIARHRFRGGNEPQTKEEKILFDADKLDILGAIGIARLFMVAGEYEEKTYSDVNMDEYVKGNFVGGKLNGRIKNTSRHSPNLEFDTKIIYIPKRLYTQKAKEIAQERLEYMRGFFERLQKEVQGNI